MSLWLSEPGLTRDDFLIAGEPLWLYLIRYINNLNTKWRLFSFFRRWLCDVHHRLTPEIDLRTDVTAFPRSRPLESRTSLSCVDCSISPRCKIGHGWVTSARPRVSAIVAPLPRSHANWDRKCSSTSARTSQLGFSQQPQTAGCVPLSGRPDWHLVMWQSLARKKKKKMDCRKPFKSHTKMSHLGLMLSLKQEW